MAKPILMLEAVAEGVAPGAPESIRSKRVVTLLADTEFEQVTKLADRDGQSVSAMVQELIARNLKRRRLGSSTSPTERELQET